MGMAFAYSSSMAEENTSEILELVEELRSLSFLLEESGSRLSKQRERLVDLTESIGQASSLKTAYEESVRDLEATLLRLRETV